MSLSQGLNMPKKAGVTRGRGSKRRGDISPSFKKKGSRIKDFYIRKGFTREHLADLLGVHVTAIYSWERGEYEPKPDTCIRLANLADGSEWEYAKDFLSWAGVELKTMEQIADNLSAERTTSSAVNVFIPSLELDTEQMQFPAALIDNPASTRFLFVPYLDEGIFKKGDIVLIDTLVTDIRKIADLEMIAVSVGDNKKAPFSLVIGRLAKQVSGTGEIYMLAREGAKSLFLADKERAYLPLLGRVVAWIRASDGSVKKIDKANQ
jgi:DNA-binding XRE family transcriptional regulator